MKKYNFQKIEAKWQKLWQGRKIFAAGEKGKNKFYDLVMFPYPSGEGLHMGHLRNYVAADIIARYQRMRDKNVLFPIGWDAFGLPAENAAIKAGIPPAISTRKSIQNFTRQIKSLGLSFDWSREINTSHPDYYRFTQWFFLLLYKNNLAYQKEAYVNFCPKDKTVLANEQVINGRCERCGTEVVQKKIKQWFFKITDFAEELLSGLDKLDWPESTKELQRNWIGKSEGSEIEFSIFTHKEKIKVFTTRADTLFGATYMVLAPDHPLVPHLTTSEQKERVMAYRKAAAQKTELERTRLTKAKSGVFTGAYALNPVNGRRLPIWVADYVLSSYGFGAVMAVPAHDERDFDFATKYKLPIIRVIRGGSLPYLGEGKLVNSGKFSGISSSLAKDRITRAVGGKKTIQYRLRDWLISRQRYWGVPIPIFYDREGNAIPLEESDLPVKLPSGVEFKPTGVSPLVDSKSFQRIPLKYKKKGAVRREADTMDTFVCSSWYFFRYADPHNNKRFASRKALKKWLPVDLYIGGAEHATGHLLYARFFTKVLYRLGLIDFDEPFIKLRHQGLILGPDGEKMSKSRGNVVNPDDAVERFGADALRMYEMFMGPFDQAVPWNTAGLEGVVRFLRKTWRLFGKNANKIRQQNSNLEYAFNHLIKKVTLDIESFHFNTVVSSFMEFINQAEKVPAANFYWENFIKLLYPFAPHISSELWQRLKGKYFSNDVSWPTPGGKALPTRPVNIAVQVNGKLRGVLSLPAGVTQVKVEKEALKLSNVQRYLADKKYKTIYVSGKILNFIV